MLVPDTILFLKQYDIGGRAWDFPKERIIKERFLQTVVKRVKTNIDEVR